jgi:HK97 gp10 family phage protein
MAGFRIVVNAATDDLVGKALADFFEHKLGPHIQANAKKLVPTETFSLRDSIVVQVNTSAASPTLQVGVDPNVGGVENVPVDYALFVERGTSRSRAQPYLEPAILQARGVRL